jgi:hypothetical protein
MLFDLDAFRSSIDEDLDIACFCQSVSSTVFHPIGELVEEPDDAEIVYVPDKPGNPVDRDWLAAMCPDISGLQAGLRQAFAQYCGPSWCGAEMVEEIQDDLEGDELERFKQDGYLPFIEIGKITFDRRRRAMIIDAYCLIDFNLDEHGISILKVGEEWTFGYGCDHDE